MAEWYYDPKTKTYINAAGHALSQAGLAEVRDQYLDSMTDLLDAYTTNLNSGAWTIEKFESEMRQRLKHAHIAEYVLGRGGIAQMTQGDYGRLGATLKAQYKYLRSYLDDLVAGKETRGQANNRARNFLGSARQSFSRGRGKAYGLDLPAHPGDGGGGTSCFGNCRCSWEIQEDDEEWRAYWQLSSNKPCEGCVSRAAQWSPYIQKKEVTT